MEENQGPEETNNVTKNEVIQYVGERNAIVFSASAGEPVPPVELPDSFFELNVDDVRLLFKEMKENREQTERMPFRTKAVREMEENAAKLSSLNRYTQTVLRVQFPDQIVLQAVFNHSETIQTVMDFVRNFLDPSDVEFHLYTAPPKSVLQPDVTLVDAKLTPRALVYISAVPHQDRTTLLKDTLQTSLTNPRLASEAALQYRRKEAHDVQPKETETFSKEIASTSSRSATADSSAKSSKVPKWFKR